MEAAALPEPAALQRDDPLPSREVPTDLTRPAQRLARKRRRKRSSALYRPAKRSPPRGALVYYINKKTGINKITYDWYKQKIYDWCINENP